MDTATFKKAFGEKAMRFGLERGFGGWFLDSPECILAIDLQRSNYGVYYMVNLKVFIQGAFGNQYAKSKDLIKKDAGDVFRRGPKEFEDVFDLENNMTDAERTKRLEIFFSEFVMPFAKKALTKAGIEELAHEQKILLLPAVKKQINEIRASEL